MDDLGSMIRSHTNVCQQVMHGMPWMCFTHRWETFCSTWILIRKQSSLHQIKSNRNHTESLDNLINMALWKDLHSTFIPILLSKCIYISMVLYKKITVLDLCHHIGSQIDPQNSIFWASFSSFPWKPLPWHIKLAIYSSPYDNLQPIVFEKRPRLAWKQFASLSMSLEHILIITYASQTLYSTINNNAVWWMSRTTCRHLWWLQQLILHWWLLVNTTTENLGLVGYWNRMRITCLLESSLLIGMPC